MKSLNPESSIHLALNWLRDQLNSTSRMGLMRWYSLAALVTAAVIAISLLTFVPQSRKLSAARGHTMEAPVPEPRQVEHIVRGFQTALERQRLRASRLPAASGVPATAAAPLPAGPFQESPSSSPIPELTMTNLGVENVYMSFTGPMNLRLTIGPGETKTVLVKTGEYSISIWGDTIYPRVGMGVFRKHRRYTTEWIVTDEPVGPLRMGDIE